MRDPALITAGISVMVDRRAGNKLPDALTRITRGSVNRTVLSVAGVHELGLRLGMSVAALIRASHVVVA
ncbi:MAG TPA: hypothetical protein VF292_01005 [Rhodanobacteraceae bacterium]